MRIVFLGTPDFAVATLDTILHSKHEVVGVVTSPDKPAGRGLAIQSSEVKKYAVEKGLSILQPVKLKDTGFIEELLRWRADIFVVVAFRMLPYEVYSIPPKGTFNVHASLLPQYRGAAPIHWAIMNGETKTGITTFFLNNEIDCGDIILQRAVDILQNETTGELYDRLKLIGGNVALETLELVENSNINPVPQSNIENVVVKLAPKIFKEETLIDWEDTATNIINKIRGLSPSPGAVTFFTINGKKKISVKIFEASKILEKSQNRAGIIDTDDRTFIHISAKDFKISIHNLQIEGRKRVNTSIFLQGNNASNYTITKY